MADPGAYGQPQPQQQQQPTAYGAGRAVGQHPQQAQLFGNYGGGASTTSPAYGSPYAQQTFGGGLHFGAQPAGANGSLQGQQQQQQQTAQQGLGMPPSFSAIAAAGGAGGVPVVGGAGGAAGGGSLSMDEFPALGGGAGAFSRVLVYRNTFLEVKPCSARAR